MITSKMRRRIKRELSAEKPTVRIGKEGASLQIQGEICRQLESKKMVKVKILKTALKDQEAADLATKIAQQTESILVDVRGHTFLLYKPRSNK